MTGCKTELSDNVGSGYVLGEMAHIEAAEAGGPRWNPSLLPEEGNRYANLILLCPSHHTEIDKNPQKWTVERLRGMKQEHEEWVRNQMQTQMAELEAKVDVRAKGGDSATGAKITKPTRIKAGTSITVETENVRRTIGLQIGEDSKE